MRNLLYFVFISALLSLGCGNEQKWANGNPDRRGETAKEQRQKLEDQLDVALRNLGHQIDALNARIEKEETRGPARTDQQEARAKLRNQAAELDRRREIARRKLEELRDSNEATWQDMKIKFDATLRDLKAECDQVASQFR